MSMVGLDTNVLVRYIAQDDTVQSHKASLLIESFTEERPGFVSLIALTELVWVIQGCYGASKGDTIAILDRLMRVPTLKLENASIVIRAIQTYAGTNADFADCLIECSGRHANCTHTMTFDAKAAKTAGMKLVR